MIQEITIILLIMQMLLSYFYSKNYRIHLKLAIPEKRCYTWEKSACPPGQCQKAKLSVTASVAWQSV